MTVTVRAHAKINLDLRVLGTRPDGFHDLRAVFQSLELHDTLTFVARKGPFALRCRQPGVPLDCTNLVWRAAGALWRTQGRDAEPRDVSVTIAKHIPICAGLGGGSANAAATLAALVRLWRVSLAPWQLHDVAASLGADVPFFLWGGTVLGLDRGDTIYQLVDLPTYWVVIVLPHAGVSTADAYAWYDEARQGRPGMWPGCQETPGPWPTQLAQMTQRPRGPSRASRARDWLCQGRASRGWRLGFGDVGEWIGRLWSVPQSPRRTGGTAGACPLGLAFNRDPHDSAR